MINTITPKAINMYYLHTIILQINNNSTNNIPAGIIIFFRSL